MSSLAYPYAAYSLVFYFLLFYCCCFGRYSRTHTLAKSLTSRATNQGSILVVERSFCSLCFLALFFQLSSNMYLMSDLRFSAMQVRGENLLNVISRKIQQTVGFHIKYLLDQFSKQLHMFQAREIQAIQMFQAREIQAKPLGFT